MQYVKSLIFQFLMYSLLLIIGVLGAPFALYSSVGTYRVIHFYCGLIRWLADKICGLRTEIRGAPPVGDVLIVAKHQSFLDIILIADAVPAVSFIMKSSLRWAPVIGFYAKRVGAVPISRGKKSQSMRQMLDGVDDKNKVEEPHQLVIYPQGTRVPPGVKAPYKMGAAVLYERLNKPVTLVATNVGVFWPRVGVLRKPGLAIVDFFETVPPGMDAASFLKLIEEKIETRSTELLNPTPRS